MSKRIVYSLQCLAVYSVFSVLFTVHRSLFTVCFAQEQNKQESDQQISDFSLAGYGEKGKKTWDIAGKSADIFDNIIKLNDVVGNLYGEEEDIKLTAQRGDFDKQDGKVHLEKDVVITTSSGGKLTTDSLDWDRKNQLVTTKDAVNIIKENMVTTGKGVMGQPNLSRVTLEKDVRVDINPVRSKSPEETVPPTAGTSNGVNPKIEEGKDSGEQNKTIITCDGPLEVDYAQNIATFKDNVKVDTHDNLIYSDIMNVYFVSSSAKDKSQVSNNKESMFMGTQIQKIIARGNVKIIHGQNTSYSDEATYIASDKKIILTGRPKLILYSTEELGASFGN